MFARIFSFSTLAAAFALLPACSSSASDDGLFDDEGATESAGSELSLCKKAACGPALGMPTILCEDGSTGGNTGRCIRKKGVCGWEIRECPKPKAVDCSAPNACGPQLGMPNYLCPDGKTWAGPSGQCLDKAGVCGWEIISCPTPPPPPARDCSAPNACGPQLGLPNHICPDGKTVAGPSGRCLDTGTACGWEVIACPK